MRLCAIAALLCLAVPVMADPVPFDKSWKTQRFSLFSSNKYGFEGQVMTIASNGSVSLAYAPVKEALWGSKSASWGWQVSQTVPATDLSLKGGDDRNASLYFVFLPEAEAKALGGKADVRKLLTNEAARVLVYVWGDDRDRGTVLSSPYLGARGKTILLRGVGTGAFAEKVDLVADYKRIFNAEPGALVGLAVSADSDDTDTVIRARITELSLN